MCQFISSEGCLMPHNRRESSALSSISRSWIPSSSSHFKNGQEGEEKVRGSRVGNTMRAVSSRNKRRRTKSFLGMRLPSDCYLTFFLLILLHSFGKKKGKCFLLDNFSMSFPQLFSPSLGFLSSDRTWELQSSPILSSLIASEITHFWLLSSRYALPFNTWFTALSLSLNSECRSREFLRFFLVVLWISNKGMLEEGSSCPSCHL